MPDDTNNFDSNASPDPAVPAELAARIDAALGQTQGPHVQGDFDETVALISRSHVAPTDMPLALKAKIEADAAAFFSRRSSAPDSTRRGAPWWLVLVGPLVAAAGVAILLVPRLPRGETGPTTAIRMEDQVQQWLDANPQVKPASFAPINNPAQPSIDAPGTGDVVWSDIDQRGFMRFVGLPENDPSDWQYQLWIFDKERDERYPVDGGVFDAPASGSGVVPIAAKIRVNQATVFAITREKPGGVVVSDRKQLVLLAKING